MATAGTCQIPAILLNEVDYLSSFHRIPLQAGHIKVARYLNS
jgi:hypothetical protein